MNKIEKIARKICGFKNNTITILEDNEIKSIQIDSIKIIIKYEKIHSSNNRIIKSSQIHNEKNGPRYKLDEVKRILSYVPINIEFADREEANPENVNLTKEDAIEVLKSLQPSEYEETSYKTGSQSADVYLAVRNILHEDIELYIKFYIKNKEFIFVISFHESEK